MGEDIPGETQSPWAERMILKTEWSLGLACGGPWTSVGNIACLGLAGLRRGPYPPYPVPAPFGSPDQPAGSPSILQWMVSFPNLWRPV